MKGSILAFGLAALVAVTVAEPAVAVAEAGVVPAGKIDSLLLSGEELMDVVGIPFEWEKVNRRPFRSDDLGKDSACAALAGPDVETFGRDYTGYRFQVDRDNPDNAEFIVQQRVATYADAATAAEIFQASFTPSMQGKCNRLTVQPADAKDMQFRYRIKTATPTAVQWVEDQLYQGEPIGYSCSDIAGVKGNVLYAVKVCQFGNGMPAATTVANRMTSQVTGVRS